MFLWSGRQAVFILDACCLRDGAHAPGLAVLVRKDCSSSVYHHDDYGVGLRYAEVGRDCPVVRQAHSV
jgi:hypothetical protein